MSNKSSNNHRSHHAPCGHVHPGRREVLAMVAGSAIMTGIGPVSAEDAQEKGNAAVPTPRIDVHYHIIPPAVLAEAGPAAAMVRGLPAVKDWDPARATDILKSDGISTAVLSFPGGRFWPRERDPQRRMARLSNDYFAKLRQDNKGLFGLFASVPPLTDLEGALAEISYGLDTLRAEGVCLMTSYGAGGDEKWLGDPSFAPVLDELNRRRAVVFVHPEAMCQCAHPPHPSLELPFDTARATFSLWHGGAFDRWPDIRFIFSHGGGPMPMLIGRYNGLGRPGPNGTILRDADVQLGRQWYDTAQAASASSIAGLLALADHGRIMFGTDVPFGTGQQAAVLAKVIKDKRLLRAIESENAIKLMPSLGRR